MEHFPPQGLEAANDNTPDPLRWWRSEFMLNLRPEDRSAAMDALTSSFKRLGLPIAESARLTHGSGWLVPVNRYACVIRFNTASGVAERQKSDHILKPLGEIRTGDFVTEVFPGTVCGNFEFEKTLGRIKTISDWPNGQIEQAKEFLDRCLQKEGINFKDSGPKNFGFLPCADGKVTSDYPVVIDLDACVSLHESTKIARRLLALKKWLGLGKPHHQDILYADLRRHFKEAVNEVDPAMQPLKMAGFWQRCVEAKKRGILVAGWEHTSQRFQENTGLLKLHKEYDEILRGSGSSASTAVPERAYMLAAP